MSSVFSLLPLQEFIPYMAKKYNFQYELVQYKWPRWLHQQTEKQRIIWGYKILFLDVLFPLAVDKILFVDADQVTQGGVTQSFPFFPIGIVCSRIQFLYHRSCKSEHFAGMTECWFCNSSMLQRVLVFQHVPTKLGFVGLSLTFGWLLIHLLLWFQLVCQTDSISSWHLCGSSSVPQACRSLTTHSVFLSPQALSSSHSCWILAWPDLNGFQRSQKAVPSCTKPCCAAKQAVSWWLCLCLLPALKHWGCVQTLWTLGMRVQWELPKTLLQTYMKLWSTDYQYINIKFPRHSGI